MFQIALMTEVEAPHPTVVFYPKTVVVAHIHMVGSTIVVEGIYV